MLRVPLMVSVVLLLALGACTESATTTFGFTSEAAPTGVVSINNFQGSVRLVKGAAGGKVTGTVRVSASGFDNKSEARDAVEGVRLVESGPAQALVIDVSIPREHRNNTFDIDLDLTVPDDVAVDVATDNGSIRVDSLPVTVLDTTNGEITMRFTKGQSAVVTNDAPISVEGHQGDLDVRTSNADIELISIQGNVSALTTIGRITARVTPPIEGEVQLSTTQGPIDLTIPSDVDGRLTALTTSPGTIFIEALPYHPQSEAPGQAVGLLGSGAGLLVDVRTTNSDVVVSGR